MKKSNLIFLSILFLILLGFYFTLTPRKSKDQWEKLPKGFLTGSALSVTFPVYFTLNSIDLYSKIDTGKVNKFLIYSDKNLGILYDSLNKGSQNISYSQKVPSLNFLSKVRSYLENSISGISKGEDVREIIRGLRTQLSQEMVSFSGFNNLQKAWEYYNKIINNYMHSHESI